MDIDYRLLFRTAPMSLVVVDPDLVIVEASDAYLSATMRDRSELVGKPVLEAFPDNPDDPKSDGPAKWGASLRKVLRERVTDTMAIQKYDIPAPDGGFDTRYWAPVNAPIFGADGELAYIVHRTEDVTDYVREQAGGDRAEAEMSPRRRLEEQNQTLLGVVDSLDAAVLGCDAAGRPVLYNGAARTLVGTALEGVPASQWGEVLHLCDPDGRPLRGDEVPAVRVLNGERIRDVEVVLRTPGEAPRHYRVHGRPVTGLPGLAVVLAMHDVTVHRRAVRLKECELEVSVIASRPGPADEVLAQVVERVGTMSGWAAVEFWTVDDVAQVLRRLTFWAGPGRDRPSRLPDPLPKGQGLPGRAWGLNEPLWATDLPSTDFGPLRAALAVPIPSGATVLGVLVCYSDTAEVPDDIRTAILTGIGAHIGELLERRRAERLAVELDRTRDEYIALVGHELRTPLTSVQTYTEFLLDDPDLPATERTEMLEVMRRNTATLHGIVAKLLDVAGIRSGHIAMQLRGMDLADVVREAAEACAAATPVAVNVPDHIPMTGDPHRLRQVVDELLGNALTWSDDHATVGITLHADDRTAVLCVSNTGERIRFEERARLFEQFFRGDAARHRGVPGTGLGLTLARAITEQHGGAIAVSEPDEAVTTFTVRLPRT